MKVKIFLFLFLAFAVQIYSQNTFRFNINDISLPLENNGIIANVEIPDPDLFINGTGGKYAGGVFLYAGGFYLSGKTNDYLWSNAVASSSLAIDYLPGIVGSNPEDPLSTFYILKSTDPPFGESWEKWKDAVSIGAEYYDGNHNNVYDPIDLNGNSAWDDTEDHPLIIGDLSVFCVYNDGQPDSLRRFNNVSPQGVEIHQTVFGYNVGGAADNTIFIKYKIINKGTADDMLDSVYFSFWTDPDIGEGTNDLAGTDTVLNAIYAYNNGPDAVQEYGDRPPAFFISLLQGPAVYIPGVTFTDNNSNGVYDENIDIPITSAYYKKGLWGLEEIQGAKNLGLTSTVSCLNASPLSADPKNEIESRNYMHGYGPEGSIISPCTWYTGSVNGDVDCKDINPLYWYSGDPINGEGWLNNGSGDIRLMANTGPFKLGKDNPVEILGVYSVARGENPLMSIHEGRNVVSNAQELYQKNFGFKPLTSSGNEGNLITGYNLSQNYPNPFNPSTILSFNIPKQEHVALKVYDILGNEVASLLNNMAAAGHHEVQFNGSNFASGVYFYQLRTETSVLTKRMMMIK